jgi:hypothetical protein
MRRSRPAFQQAGFCVDQGTGAHAGHQRNVGALPADPVEMGVVEQLWSRALNLVR